MHFKTTLFLLFLFTAAPLKIWALTILIDPGHGGEDRGALGGTNKKLITEKDLTLIYAKKIFRKLKNKKHQVFLTRSLDRSVSLNERAELADKIKADLFISIHINSSKRKSSQGFEIFYLDNHSDVAVKKVEEVENKDLKGEALVINQILTDLVIERTAKKSKKLAASIYKHIRKPLADEYKMKDRGVKPGLFYVLALTKRPAVLIEIGFISNARELRKMMSRGFQETYTTNVVKGIEEFIKGVKRKDPALF